jgi:hypothetical protein
MEKWRLIMKKGEKGDELWYKSICTKKKSQYFVDELFENKVREHCNDLDIEIGKKYKITP